MEEDNITDELETRGRVSNTTYIEWLKNKNVHPLFVVGVLVFIVILVAGLLVYVDVFKLDSRNQDQSTGQDFNFTDEEKEDILKSLGSDSVFSDISNDEKHQELDQLYGQVENNIQLREFEKVDILNRLSQ